MGRYREIDFYFTDLENLSNKRRVEIYSIEEGSAERLIDSWIRYERNMELDNKLAGLRYRGRYSAMDYRKFDAQSNEGLIYKVVDEGVVLYRDKNGVVFGEVDEVEHLHYGMKWRLGGSKKFKLFHWMRYYGERYAFMLWLYRILHRIF